MSRSGAVPGKRTLTEGVAPGKQSLTSKLPSADPKRAQKPLTKQEAFVHKYAASAASLENKDGIPALFTLAQGALESGWGERAINNALFGIKVGASWTGKKQLVTTTEYFPDDKQGSKFPEVISITKVADHKYKYIVKDYFRDYDTVEEGLADHSAFLTTHKRYASAFTTTTPDAFAQAVADAGYSTSGGYGATLKSMIASVKKRWPKEVPMPSGNAKAVTGGKPGGAAPTPAPGNKEHADTGTPAHANGSDKPHPVTASPADSHPAAETSKTISGSVGANGVKDFQHKTFGWRTPNGLVEPGGETFKALAGGGHAVTASHTATATAGHTTTADHTAANAPANANPPPSTPKMQTRRDALSVGTKLDMFYDDFSQIEVTHVNKTVVVKPPYYINIGWRKENALNARKANSKVKNLLDYLVHHGKITANALVGKSQPSDLKVILEAAVNDSLVTFEAGAMTNFLATYGLSVDCSGYVSQALNHVIDGNNRQDERDAFQPDVTSSDSLSGGQPNFAKVKIGDVQPGDTMHLSGHIRIIDRVDRPGDAVYFRTTESTAAVNPHDGSNGLAQRWWKWDGQQKYTSWKSGDTPPKFWKPSIEKDNYGRYTKLTNYPSTTYG